MNAGGPLDWFFDLFRGSGGDPTGQLPLVLVGGTLVILLLIGLLIVRRLLRRKPPAGDRERHLREHLAEYPPAPGAPGPQRLSVQGKPARLRLVVVAPLGQQAAPNADEVERFLDQLLHGLGAVAQHDKPRVAAWPGQLSQQGFPPTFHRLVTSPDAEGAPSRWVVLAGTAKVGKFPVLLGMALHTDAPNTLGKLHRQPHQWAEMLRVS